MKISINSTFSYIKFNLNYGSTLQCYALQKYLKKRGHYVEHLRDYRANPIYIIQRFKNIKYTKLFFQKVKAMWKMQQFVKDNLILSKRAYFSDRALKKHGPIVDCHIVGSDQIWHNTNKFRYLTYAPTNALKLSYAASFGRADISNEMKAIIKPWLKRFDGLSVREKSGVNIINSMGMEAKWVLDPTLLLDYIEYPVKENGKSHYFYCYFLNLSKKKDIPFETIKKIVNDKDEQMIITAPLNYMYFIDERVLFPSVEEWLGLYKNATCIFTNTYHGLLFCIIFKKQFVFFAQKSAQKSENERFYSLLKLLDLEERLVTNDDQEMMRKLIDKKINYEKVYRILAQKRKETDIFFSTYNI